MLIINGQRNGGLERLFVLFCFDFCYINNGQKQAKQSVHDRVEYYGLISEDISNYSGFSLG